MTRKEYFILIFLLLLAALTSMVLVAYATTLGPGVGGDATIYLTSAKNLLAGRGLGWVEADGTFRLLPYSPPFYPLALSVAGFLAGDFTAAARWLNILLFGGLVFLTGWYFARLTARQVPSSSRPWLSGVLAGLVACSPVMVGVQVWAMSESLFLLLGFAALLLLADHFAWPHPRKLIIAAVLAGLALLTRYMGVAFVATGGLALLCMGPGGRLTARRAANLRRGPNEGVTLQIQRGRIREAFWFGLIALAPMVVWLAIDFSVTGTVASRSAQPAAAYWQRFLEIGPALHQIVLFWLLPDSIIARIPGLIQVALWLIPLAGMAGFAWLVRRSILRRAVPPEGGSGGGDRTVLGDDGGAAWLAFLLGLFIVVYLVVLTFVQVFTYPPITLASRMLSPVHLAVLALLLTLIHLGVTVCAPCSDLVVGLISLVMVGLLGSYLLRSVMIARDYHQDGIGYNARAWRESQVIEAVRTLPAETPLISNEVTAIMYLAGRPAYALQEIYQDQPQQPFSVYGSGEDAAQQVFRSQDGALVLFEANLREDFSMYGDQVDRRLEALTDGLYRYFKGEDGAIYFAGPPSFLPAIP